MSVNWTSSLRTQVLVPFIRRQLLLLAAAFAVEAASGHDRAAIKERVKKLKLALSLIQRDERISADLTARDRKKVLEIGLPVFKKLNSELAMSR
jgi:hypothetical protein